MTEGRYVEMICRLAERPEIEVSLPEGYERLMLDGVKEDDLYPCYCAAFQAGDARFFFDQNEEERRAYFDTLCLDEARDEPGSSLILKDGGIAGFTYVLPYGDTNRHISCMCIHPDHQRRGLGRFMLGSAMQEVAAQGHKSITLGTDTDLVAFHFYRKYGFKIMKDDEQDD
jgi:ribosomal protein S18 acetylase RimI-like enzyme